MKYTIPSVYSKIPAINNPVNDRLARATLARAALQKNGLSGEYPAPEFSTLAIALSIAGAATGAYHGYKRNGSAGWAFGWFLLGGMFPYFTIPVSIAQGFGKPRSKE